MTHEEKEKMICDMHSGMRMLIEGLSAIGMEKTNWTLDEMGKCSDIIKDVACAHKDLAKAHYYMSEHSYETYKLTK